MSNQKWKSSATGFAEGKAVLSLFDDMHEEIRSTFVNGRIYYMPAVGNWGDSLIREGFESFAEHFGIQYQKLDRLDLSHHKGRIGRIAKYMFPGPPRSDDMLIYGGSGGWCHNYHGAMRDVQLASRIFGKIIVLPSTYEMRASNLGSNVILLARDATDSIAVYPTAKFYPDCAFFLQSKFERDSVPIEERVGHFLRTDRESARRMEIPESNVDISLLGDSNTPIDKFMREVGRYETVVTDRLHVAIGAAIMGRMVKLRAGNYFKNKAVYDSVFRRFYSGNVTFVDTE